jgi:Protein of unknown function (DUF3302)
MTRTVSHSDHLITGPIDIYTWLMIGVGIVLIVVFFAILIWIMGLPGKIALQRRHPHAETVKIMGYAGLLPVFPWIHAFIWAFHDSVTVDVRRFPREEAEAIERDLKKLAGEDEKPAETTRVEIDKPTMLPDPAPKT